jgi:hypothetical protein
MNGWAGLFNLGLSVRSIATLNVSAVTGSFDGGEKRKPPRMVYVSRPTVG